MKYLTVALANQIRGIELDQVREWLGYLPFAPAASPDPATVGLLAYRGNPIPVIDLRLRFGLPAIRTELTSMLIVNVFGQSFALIVDTVLNVRDNSFPPRMNEKPFTPIDLMTYVQPRPDLKIAA